METIVKLFQEDLLKGIQSLLLIARDSDHATGKKATISIGLIVVLSAVLAVVRSLYSPAGVGIGQHFLSTFAILLSFYLVFGTAVLLSLQHSGLAKINQYVAAIFTCLLVSGILYFVSTLLFGFFTVTILDWIDDNVLPYSIRDTWTVLTMEDWAPAMLFSALGCWVVLRGGSSREKHFARDLIYFVATTGVFYLAVFDRGGFFDNVTKLLSGISLKSTHHGEIGALLLQLNLV